MRRLQETRGHPKVSVIVLNWNGFKDTMACIDSLIRCNYVNSEIIVVDNGSTDDSVRHLRSIQDKIILLESKDNLGFASGNNIGIEYALENGAEYILLLNNDAVIEQDAVQTLVETMEDDNNLGLIGPKIYDYNEPNKIWFAGASIDWRTGESPHSGKGEIDHGQFNAAMEVDRLSGCAMLIKTEVFERIGYLDPDYFLYFEDVDFCVRARKAGYKIIYVPQAKVWHKGSMSTKANHDSPLHAYYHNRNRLIFLNKHGKISIREHIKNMLRIFIGSRYKRLGIMDYYLGRFGRKSRLEELS